MNQNEIDVRVYDNAVYGQEYVEEKARMNAFDFWSKFDELWDKNR